MIYILTSGEYDLSTDHVIQWLNYYNANYIRLNVEELENSKLTKVYIDSHNNLTDITYKDHKIDFSGSNVIWYRRLGIKREDFKYDCELDSENFFKLIQFRNNEWSMFIKIFLNSFSQKTIWFDDPRITINKINVLNIAKKLDIQIPEYVITNSLDSLGNDYKKYITKPLFEQTYFNVENVIYPIFTNKVKRIKKEFLPSLFQQRIEKKYEIRSFYLDGEFYSMAIFSQNDKKTSIDFRNYNWKKPNRNVPYKLPKEIEKKLDLLMNNLKLKNGSIDIIRGVDNYYYFLEVNPVGQFGMVSNPCNYNIEEKFALKLIEQKNKKKI